MIKTKARLLRPEFFIVGAPKAGTTALHFYLSEHPSIFMPQQVEPFYFADDLNRTIHGEPFGIAGEEEYLRLFENPRPEQKIAGEKSVWYLHSRTAAGRIKAFAPHAKIIVMLRNPVDLFASLHNHWLFSLDEDQRDAEEAWRLQERRAAGDHLPATCERPEFLRYREVCRLGEQAERLLNTFDRSQVKFVLFDDFTKDTRAVYEDVLLFLEAPNDRREDFPPVNEAAAHRSPLLASALGTVKLTLRRMPCQSVVRPMLNALAPVKHALRAFNRVHVKKSALRPEFRRELENEFREDASRLEDVLGRWLPWFPQR